MKKIIKGGVFLLLLSLTNRALSATAYVTDTTKTTTARNFNLAGSPYLRLQLAKDAINTDDIMIRFNNAATTGYDLNMDAPYFQGNGQVNLSSISSDNVSLAINVLPFPQKSVTVPLKVLAKYNGTYNLNLIQLVNVPPLFNIVLEDHYNKDSIDIRHINSYRFNILKSDTNTYGSTRFTLVIRQNPALALQLISFGASKADSGANLLWTTVNEQNYTKFTVERSTDNGQNFNVIDTLTSTASGTYVFLDKNPVHGTDLYRLKLQDIADAETYSSVVTLIYSGLNNRAMSVYPNPAGGTLNLSITPATDSNIFFYKIQIFNTAGCIIKSATISQKISQTDVSALTPGTYIIRVLSTKDDRVLGRGTFIKL